MLHCTRMAVKASLITWCKCLVNNLINNLNTFNTVIKDMRLDSVSQVDTFIVIVLIHCNEIMQQIQFFKCKYRVLNLHVKRHNALKSKLTYLGHIYFWIKHLEDMKNFVLLWTFSSLFVQWKLLIPNMLCDIYVMVLSVIYSKFSYIPLKHVRLPCACLY